MILFFIVLALSISYINTVDMDKWELFDTNAFYLSIRQKDMVKLLANDLATGGYAIHVWTEANPQWSSISGRCMIIDLDANFYYCMNSVNTLFMRERTDPAAQWISTTTVTDIKVGVNDDVWFTTDIGTTNPITDGYTIKKLIPAPVGFIDFPEGATKVGPDHDGKLWAVDFNLQIKQWDGGSWITHSGDALDIVVGDNDLPFILGTTGSTEGNEILRWDNSFGLQPVEGIEGRTITLDDRNNLYVITDNNNVYRPKGVMFDLCPSKF